MSSRRIIQRLTQDEIDKCTKIITPNILDDKRTKLFNISINDMNYIINEIVEWSISDKLFNEFVENVKDDKQIMNNLLPFIYCIPPQIRNEQVYYIIFVIGKIGEYLHLNGLIYYICAKYKFNKFGRHFINFINKRFNEHYNYNFDYDSQLDKTIKAVEEMDNIFNSYEIVYNVAIPEFVNYCIITNNMELFKKFMLLGNSDKIFYFTERYIKSVHRITLSIYWRIDFYIIITQYLNIDKYKTCYDLLNNPLFNTNKDITDNYKENYNEDIKTQQYYLL